MLRITRRITLSAVAAAALTTAAAAPAAPAAHAASSGTYLYDVTVKAQMSDAWSFKEVGDIGAPWDPCTSIRQGSGSASWQLHSRRPTRVMVMKGFGGRQPMLSVGTGEGVPLTGSYRRTGSDVQSHEGSCAAANPTVAQPTTGCGTKSAGFAFNLAWKEGVRNTVYPSVAVSEPSDGCPNGPDVPLDWADDQSPTLMEVTAPAGASKFLGTRQFTVRGNRTFTGTMPAASAKRSGTQKVTWQWEATYRLVGGKHKRRRR